MPFILRTILWLISLSFTIAPLTSHINASEAPAASEMTAPAESDPVKISVIHEEDSIQPGRPFFIAVHLKIDNEWHAYWKNSGDAGMPLDISWNLPEGFEAGPLHWPTPKRLDTSKVTFGYEDSVVLLAQITPTVDYSESSASITANIRWVVCSHSSCLPGDGQVEIKIPVASSEPRISSEHQEFFSQARALLPKKYDAVKVKRKNDLLEIAFDELKKESEIKHVEFFPEHKKAIDLTTPGLLQESSDNSSGVSLLIKEISSQTTLKGVLVVHTNNGKEAYDIDAPIIPYSGNDSVISMSDVGAKGHTSHETSKHATHSSFEFEGGVGLAIILAFIGGLILNLMPCVLPVISFKILGFIKLAGQSRKLIFQHGLAFSIGVLISFWVLAALLLILQAYGRSVGWGFQLQEPLFVAILAAFLFIFGLSLFGLFEIGTSLMTAAGDAQQKTNKRNQLLSSFFSGILATAVATPCTGPFLGSAVGFAVTLPALQAMLIFTSLGLGMSAPYIALAAFPSLLRFLPKPGPWMVTFKELMGFLMMASVLWLVWVFGAQTNSFAVTLLLAGFLLFAIAGWIFGRWSTPLSKKLTRTIGTLAATLFFAMGTYALVVSTSPWVEQMGGGSIASQQTHADSHVVWEEFSPERVAELRAQGTPVFIDFTAKWCLICQTNHVVLSGDEVSDKFNERGVVRMKADWTKRDETIAAELRKFGRNSVPLYVLYDGEPDSDPQILPQVLTADTVMDSLNQL